MADKKISELTELTSADSVTDLLPVVDTSADETKKIRFSNLPLSDSAKNSVYTYTTDFHGPTAETRNITAPLTYQYYGDDTTLTSIYIGSNVPSIGVSAFIRCDALTDVTIANGITSIGENAFRSCPNLTSITIPDSVTSIGRGAFQNCTSLTSATIPSSVTSIGDNAFRNGVNLATINCNVDKTVIDNATDVFINTQSPLTINAPSGLGWTAGSGQTIGGNINVTVNII